VSGISVVVLNHVRPEATRACLASIGRNRYPDLRVVVVDTGAMPGAERLVREVDLDVQLVALGANRGYAGGVNAGLKVVLGDGAAWVLVLNDDVVLADDCIERLAAAVDADRTIGIAGPVILQLGAPSTVLSAGGRLAVDWSADLLDAGASIEHLRPDPRQVDWVPGCAMLASAELCRDVGLLDERFFLYWEEVEWGLRARRRGWRIVLVPDAHAWHGDGREGLPSESVTYYITRNHLLALAVHRAPVGVWLRTALRLAATTASWSIRPKWCDRRANARAIKRGVADFMLRRFGERR